MRRAALAQGIFWLTTGLWPIVHLVSFEAVTGRKRDHWLVQKTGLTGVDRTIGGGFGLIRGVLIGVVMVWIVGLTPARQDPWWKESVLIPPLEWLADGFRSILPEKWARYAEPAADAAEAAKEGL